MTDRELLELAAKAAGHAVQFKYKPGGYYLPIAQIQTTLDYWSWWEPLTDDGDALRLAVKLGIDIEVDYVTQTANSLWVDKRGNPGKFKDQLTVFYGESDPYEATRRAIVRAAAEIGKGQP